MYRIIGADGKEYGPISADQLRQWIAEGRANAQTRILAEGSSEWRPLSDYPEFIPTPVGAAPSPPPLGAPAAITAMVPGAIADVVNGPAIGLIITGVLNILTSIARAVMLLAGMGANMVHGTGTDEIQKLMASMMGTFGLAFGVIGVIVGIVNIVGGIKMKKLESYGFAMTASILALIPCVSPCCLVGMPIGIWALVVLAKPEVKSNFH